MIRHTVAFKLKHSPGSPQEADFLAAAKQLAGISAVKSFECLRQVSPKNDYTFGLSMEFSDEAGYRFYNEHPDHVHFVRTRWMLEVESFLEIDYEPLLPVAADFSPGTRFVIKEFDVPLVQDPAGVWFNWYGGSPQAYDAASLRVDNHWPAGSFAEWLGVVVDSLPKSSRKR